MIDNILYTVDAVDRASHYRSDAAWLQQRIAAPESGYLLLHEACMWVAESGPDQVVHCVAEEPWLAETKPIFLGLYCNRALFAVDLDDLAELPQPARPGAWRGLREMVATLAPADASLAAYARAMIFWQRRHRFCGSCGTAVAMTHAGHVGQCQSSACGAQVFPRTDAAVIMLVEYRPKDGVPLCLLGRGVQWPPGFYSTLAGFLEPGESLEQAVRREVYEEAAVQVGDVEFLGSQPWPFPSSLMVGFRAQALSREICIDPDELAEAAWFTPAEVVAYFERTPERANSGSISTRLIHHWLDEQRAAGWL